MQYFRVSILAGVVVTVPVAFYNIYAFAKPGLKKSESTFFKLVMLLGLILFCVGVLFAYKLMMPFMLRFLSTGIEGAEYIRPVPVSRATSTSARPCSSSWLRVRDAADHHHPFQDGPCRLLCRRHSHCLQGDDTPASSASTSPEAPASSVSELEPIGLFTVEDFPKLDGSTACIPLMAQMMADTTGIDLEVAQSGISVSTTAYAWENFGLYPDEEYTARMLVVYEAPDYVKEELKEANAQLEQKPIGRDALVFIVNENNPVKSLTRQQLKDIYAGKITNWKEVGGEDLAIVPFQRGEDSGSQTLFRKLLIQGGELMDPPTELAPAAMGELVDSIAAYNNSANAIGFSVYYYIDQMYSQPGLRLLAVDGVTPSNDTIASESYPLCNEFYAVLHADAAADSPERQLYDWLDTAAGQDCIKKSGYVAVAPTTAANSAV